MSGASKKLMGTTAAGGFTAIEDVFSTYLYTGNGSTQTITNGIDLAGEGGLVWMKNRTSSSYSHALQHTTIADGGYLSSNTTAAFQAAANNGISAFNSDGFTFDTGNWEEFNNSSHDYASWTFRKAPRFFDVVTYTGTGSARTVSHDLGTTVGTLIVKRTDSTSDWATFQRSEGGTKVLYLNYTSPSQSDSTQWNNTAPTSTQFTVGTSNDVNASGGTYVAYLFAHDPLGPSGDGSDGLIACGSYTGNGSTDGPEIDLGWEPQWILLKNASAATSGGITCNWRIYDTMRGWVTGGSESRLFPNLSNAENTANDMDITATGFKATSSAGSVNGSGEEMVYIAIRRGPMRAPESGTEVYSAGVVQNNTGRTLTNPLGYPSDMAFTQTSAGGDWIWQSRLTGTSGLFSNNTSAESTVYGYGFDNNTNYEAAGTAAIGAYGWNFRRAPGFFDVVAYTGDGNGGRQIPHNLGVAPELAIIKCRSTNSPGGTPANWAVYSSSFGSDTGNYLFLNKTDAVASTLSIWQDGNTVANMGETYFEVGNDDTVNRNPETYIAYLFASLPGISKVGSYTGDGTGNRVIDCGFTTGARFLFIKRTDGIGNWSVWDTERGILTGQVDARLELNTTDAEDNTSNHIDPDPSGFKIISNFNTSGQEYIFYAVA